MYQQRKITKHLSRCHITYLSIEKKIDNSIYLSIYIHVSTYFELCVIIIHLDTCLYIALIRVVLCTISNEHIVCFYPTYVCVLSLQFYKVLPISALKRH